MNIPVGLLIVLTLFISCHGAEDPIVQLPKGKIRGHVLMSEDGKPYYAFQEIPYAAPPIGSNRFQLPKEPQAWSEILNTTRNTVVCYQGFVQDTNLKISEDCLYVNVYTPVAPGTSEKLPVLVWIHGGSFVLGCGTYETYGPKYLMDEGIVVVAFNYRLGPFGFLSTEDDVIPPNLGLKDQHFALEWVHENIELFGGNKSHVTIAGESAGSTSVGLHLLGPWENNKILYQAAILQSGSTIFFTSNKKCREAAFNVGHIINPTFASEKSEDLLQVLQDAPAEKILYASTSIAKSWPIVEKSGGKWYDNLETGNLKKVPIIIGFTSEEMLALTSALHPEYYAVVYDKDPSYLIGDNFNNFNVSDINRRIAGNLLKKIYTNTTFQDNLGAVTRYNSDAFMTTPIIKQATLHSKYADVYLYEFAYKGELGMQMNVIVPPGCDSVSHAEDLKYMWDDKSNSDLSKFPAADRLMLRRFIKLWTNFVKYHNPTPTEEPLPENIIWPRVDPNQPDNIQYLNMNATFEVRTNPRYYQKVIEVVDRYIISKDIN